MKKLAKAAFALGLTWVVVTNMFVMASHADRILQQAETEQYDVPPAFVVPLYAGALIGAAADVAFNISYGTVRFLEFPKELMFTARVNRLLWNDGWRGELALEWCQLLDRVDPAHCSDLDNVLGLVPEDAE